MRTVRLAKHFLMMAFGLLLWSPWLYAQPSTNATEYVAQVRHNIYDLRSMKHYATLMDEMETLDRSISQGVCKHTVDAISVAGSDHAKGIALRNFERCFDADLQRKRPSAGLRAMGVTTYRGLNTAYVKVLKEQFRGKRIDFAARGAELEQELVNYLEKQETNVAIVANVFKDVQVKYPSSGNWQQAKSGEVLTRHTLLKTGESGRARVEFLDRFIEKNSGPSVINVRSNSQLNMAEFKIDWGQEERKTGLIDLFYGGIRLFSKGWGGRAAFSVRTGTSLCGIRGTDIEIHYDPDEDRTYYKLYEGVVEISTPDEKFEKFILRAGSSVTVTRGQRSAIMPIAPPS